MIEPVSFTQEQETHYVCRIEVFIMMFKKVNAHTIKCMIAEHEIVEMGFELEDICKNQDLASEFMKQIIEKGNEAGYEISENVSTVQATFLPNHQVVLCFSDDESEGLVDKTIDNLLRAFGLVNTIGKDKLQDISKLSGQEKKDAFDECMEEAASAKEVSEVQEVQADRDETPAAVKEVIPQSYLLEFMDLDTVEDFCKVAPRVPGKLYKDENRYFMVSDLTHMEDVEKKTFLLQASEFTISLKKEHFQKGYLEEHCDVLIKENPMEILREL